MKKYLKEIEVSGLILTAIGIVSSLIWGVSFGALACGFGLLLMLVVFLYKTFHWKEYERENKQYTIIILVTIFILLFQMLRAR